jgi:hypothetical protein
MKSPKHANQLPSDFGYIRIWCTELVKPELYLSQEKEIFLRTQTFSIFYK